MISLVGFSQCVPHSQAIGQWKNPEDQFAEGYRQLESWCHIAKTLEKGFTINDINEQVKYKIDKTFFFINEKPY